MTQPNPLMKSEETLVSDLRRLFRRYGYRQYKMTKFEEYDLYVDNKRFLISDHVLTFTDLDGQLRAMKPDVTLSIAKNVSAEPETAQKLYYHENVYRAERGSKEYREIMQMGLESIGNIDDYTTGEAVMLAAESLALISSRSILDLSHLGLVNAVFDSEGLTGPQRSTLLKEVSAKNPAGVRACCEDFGLSDQFTDRLAALTALYGPIAELLPTLRDLSPNPEADKAIDELKSICDQLAAAGCRCSLNLDFSIVNDMNYYNGIIFQGYIEGIPTPVISGGRYDNLLKKFGKPDKAVGFAIYLSVLEQFSTGSAPYDTDILLLYTPETAPSRLAAAVKELTDEGSSVQVQQTIPSGLKYRKLLKLTKGGLTTLEEYA